MDEMEFTEAESNMNDLVSEYQQYQDATVLGDKIIHVGLGFCKFHLVHALTRVPVEERLAPEHRCEILSDTFEHLLNRRGVARESNGHLEPLWRDVTNASLDVVGNPLHKVA